MQYRKLHQINILLPLAHNLIKAFINPVITSQFVDAAIRDRAVLSFNKMRRKPPQIEPRPIEGKVAEKRAPEPRQRNE